MKRFKNWLRRKILDFLQFNEVNIHSIVIRNSVDIDKLAKQLSNLQKRKDVWQT